MFALGGCPGQRKPQLILPKQPDQYDLWAQGLQQEDAFYAELQRLQRLYADPPDLALAEPQAFDGEYTLKSRIEDKRAGLSLTDRKTGEQWTLWFLDNTGGDAPQLEDTKPPESDASKPATNSGSTVPSPTLKDDLTAQPPKPSDKPTIEVTRDEASAGGYTIELTLDGGAVAMSLVARWVQGRYLQCTRELTLSGLDQAQQALPSQTTWALEGAWLPYRLAPGLSGPYGVVPDTEADGAWHGRLYPVEAMVPAVAAYDRTHGFMLAVSDDHPRKLDRRYDLDYAIPKGLAPGALIRCTYTTYDGTRDDFGRPWLASSLPIRDSVVLEPLKLVCKSADPTLVEAESAEVIKHVADFVHAYHFVPKPPALPEPGAIVRASQLPELAAKLGQNATLADGITQAAGPCGAKLCLMDISVVSSEEGEKRKSSASPAPSPPLAGIGIDPTGLAGGKELSSEQVQQIRQLKQGGLAAMVETGLNQFQPRTGFAHIQPEWFVSERGMVLADIWKALHSKASIVWPETAQPNWRNPLALAWFTRKLTGDLARYPDVAGYCIQLPEPLISHGWSEPATPLTGSYDAQCAVFQLHLGEAIHAVRSDAWLVSDTMPTLGAPPWCGLLIPSEAKQVNAVLHSDFASRDWNPLPVPTQRLSTFLLNKVFGTQPYLNVEPDSLSSSPAIAGFARSVSRMVGTTNGTYLEQTDAPGFPTFATHQYELQAASGELRVVYSDPAKNAYTGGDERPAVCTKQIAILPGNWTGAQAVWVCFQGIGGSLRVDKYNYLSISWDGGGWTGKLPTGYWEIEHPSKGAQIEPGDAVLIQLKPISPMFTPGKPVG